MSITEKDIKLLWGKSAGRCNNPECRIECFSFFENQNINITLGEMAHVIAESPKGPRGDGIGNDNTYSNLILLCPTHHKEIDKAPTVFPIKLLHDWKNQHEQWVASTLSSSKVYDSFYDCCEEIKRLLIQNKTCWKQYGPESEEAMHNPYSSLADLWPIRKLSVIVPTNKRICTIIKSNESLVPIAYLDTFHEFIEHASGFERNCYHKTEGVSRFPKRFEEIIDEAISKRV